ncbi:MAG TPA: hypothetical protein VMC82_01190 [Thermoplasmata archaeon]|nr:hypothetical protein [Thermoplasmata archaeon]
MSGPRVVRARAFAPGHVTGIFAPSPAARDPRARGSIGAGLVLELGVSAAAEFRAGTGRTTRVLADVDRPLPISEEVARRLRPARRGALTVRLVHHLPIGQGFGMSAAGAAATALAVAAVAGHSRRVALETAHLADLFGAGGLGGVAAIADGGGLELRRRAGLAPWGRVEHARFDGAVFVGVAGAPLPSPRLLGRASFLERVAAAAGPLPDLLRHPSPVRFFDASERFTDRLGLAPPPLRRVVTALRARGARAAQAMFGRSFFAYAPNARARRRVVAWLTDHRLPALELRTALTGAHRLRAAQPF